MKDYLGKNSLEKLIYNIKEADAAKQDKLTGTEGQVVGFDANGNPVAANAKRYGKVTDVVLSASAWGADKTQTVHVDGILADESKQVIQISPASESKDVYNACSVLGISQAENSLTFGCNTVPTTDLTVYIVVTSAFDVDINTTEEMLGLVAGKQDKLSGSAGQVVGFNDEGTATAVNGWSNDNLLINWDFRKVVNRKGNSIYDKTNTISIDNWICGKSSTLEVNGGKITVSSSGTSGIGIRQLLYDDFVGQELTMSALSDQNELVTVTGVVPPAPEGDANGFAYTPVEERLANLFLGLAIYSDGSLQAGIVVPNGQSVGLLAAKLELGDKQTLARKNADGEWEIIDPPDYDAEYQRCSLYNPVTGKWTGYTYSNENLLDNWYFADPINQRNVKEWSNSYGIDRWYVVGTATVGDKGITLNNDSGISILWQRPENINFADGRTRTISYLDSDGNVYHGPFTAGYTQYGNFQFAYNKGNEIYIKSANPAASIQCIKLELGPVQTLAHKEGDTWVLNDPPPNKAQELLKCQRYFYNPLYGGSFWASVGMGMGLSTTTAGIFVDFPVEMRTVPAMKYSGDFILTQDLNSSKDISVTGITRSPTNDSLNRVLLLAAGSNVIVRASYVLRRKNNATASLSFSSDL